MSDQPTTSAIECDSLDKENLAWAASYLQKLETALGQEDLDERYITYLQREIAAYRELIARFSA